MKKPSEPLPEEIKLTPLEVKLIALEMKEYTYRMIALYLHFKLEQIKSAMKGLHHKLGKKSMAGIIVYAFTHGFTYNEATKEVYYEMKKIA